MAEEFENYEARLAEARRAVERWETEGGAQQAEQPAERAPETTPRGERDVPPGEADEGQDDRGESAEG